MGAAIFPKHGVGLWAGTDRSGAGGEGEPAGMGDV